MKKLNQIEKGFTLIELMVTVAIIGLIAAIAVPNYIDYVQQGKASEATSNLADLRIKMEQCYQDNRSYAACNAFCVPNSHAPDFAYRCDNIGADTYTLVATGAGDMAGFSFQVDESNNKQSSFDGNNGVGCWLMSKTGAC